MFLSPSNKTIEIVQDLFDNFTQSKAKGQKDLITKLAQAIVQDLSAQYFGIEESTNKLSLKIINNGNSFIDRKTHILNISIHKELPSSKRLPQIIYDTVHESVHKCQFLFFKNKQRIVGNGYLSALQINTMHPYPLIYFNGKKHENNIDTYMQPSDKKLCNCIYAAQPTEAQAYALADKFCTQIVNSIGFENGLSLYNVVAMEHDFCPAEIDRVCNGLGIENICGECSKLLLNLHCGTDFALDQKVVNTYKTFLNTIQNNKIDFIGTKELYLPNYSDFDKTLDSKIANEQILDVAQSRKEWNDFVTDTRQESMIISNTDELQTFQSFGRTYKLNTKEMNQFLFSIGEKPFQELELDK